MGTEAQRRRGDAAMALHGVRRSGEAGTPLPGTTTVGVLEGILHMVYAEFVLPCEYPHDIESQRVELRVPV